MFYGDPTISSFPTPSSNTERPTDQVAKHKPETPIFGVGELKPPPPPAPTLGVVGEVEVNPPRASSKAGGAALLGLAAVLGLGAWWRSR